MDKNLDLAIKFAKKVKEKGGQTYFVGGLVRDKFLNRENKDIDLEIHNISKDEVINILSQFGKVSEIGASFGVLNLNGYDIDFAFPRTETKTGLRHNDFLVEVDEFMGLQKACERRDFTINSMLLNVLSNELVDFYNGQKDLENGVIRATNENTFKDDPLRVLRACQFSARFNFVIAPETLELCKSMDISNLPIARIYMEFEKAMLKSIKPSIFFKLLKDMNHLKEYFTELSLLDDTNFNIMCERIDDLKIRNIENILSIIAITLKTNTDADILSFLDLFINKKALKNKVLDNCNAFVEMNNNFNELLAIRKLASQTSNNADNIKEIARVFIYCEEIFNKFNNIYDDSIKFMNIKLVETKDLFRLGFKPSKEIGLALKDALNLQINGLTKEEILETLKNKYLIA